MRIHQITDLHIPGEEPPPNYGHVKNNVRRQMSFVAQDDSDLLVISGDLSIPDGSREACEWINSVLPEQKIIVMPGNHDNPRVLWEVFGEERCINERFCFSFHCGLTNVIFVNTNTDSLPEDQIDFIRSEAANDPSVLFIHHPPNLVSNGFMALNQPLHNHAEVGAAIRETNISDVFCGHYHNSIDKDCGGFLLHVTSSPAFQIDLDVEKFTMQPFEPVVRIIEIADETVKTHLTYV